ncbi:PspC domain-containing protein [Streptomyces sp. XC 2026]|nr:PspC domain-containing protein [Streptomyces sp. XC 2026]
MEGMSVDEAGPSAPPAAAASPAAPVTARLTRSRRHKVAGGVCGGLGRYFHLDPVLFRVPLAVLSVIGGLGLIAYGVAWLLIPFEGEEENEGRRLLSGRVEGPGLTALLCTLVGCGLYVASVSTRHPATWFSAMLVASVGGAAYWSRRRALAGEDERERHTGAAEAVATAPPEAQAPPARAVASWWREAGGPGGDGGRTMAVHGSRGPICGGRRDAATGAVRAVRRAAARRHSASGGPGRAVGAAATGHPAGAADADAAAAPRRVAGRAGLPDRRGGGPGGDGGHLVPLSAGHGAGVHLRHGPGGVRGRLAAQRVLRAARGGQRGGGRADHGAAGRGVGAAEEHHHELDGHVLGGGGGRPGGGPVRAGDGPGLAGSGRAGPGGRRDRPHHGGGRRRADQGDRAAERRGGRAHADLRRRVHLQRGARLRFHRRPRPCVGRDQQ